MQMREKLTMNMKGSQKGKLEFFQFVIKESEIWKMEIM